MRARERREFNKYPPKCPDCRNKAVRAYVDGRIACGVCGYMVKEEKK